MDVVELIEVALANADHRRVEVTALEPAVFSTEAIGGLTGLISELVSDAIALSTSEEKVRVTGSFDGESYLISVSGRGVGFSQDGIGVINRMLEDPELALGIGSMARVAARHGLAVRLVPSVAGATARVTVPTHLVATVQSGARQQPDELVDLTEQGLGAATPVDFIPHELDYRARVGRARGRSESAWSDSEAFLEEVFTPLMRESHRPDTQPTSNGGNGRVEKPWTVEREPHGTATALRVRMPGETYVVIADDSPSTAAAESAVDLKSALSTFDQGRRSAEQAADRDSGRVEASVPVKAKNVS
ncbi:MAG: hypothetical protein ACRDWS_04280 [Acidimicrobiia bacterium]